MKVLVLLIFALSLQAQLPEPSALLAEAKANQLKLDAIRDNYTFHMLRQTDDLDKNGAVTKSTSIEREIFFVNGRRIARLLKKDGKPLAPAEDKAEQARVQKEVEAVVKGGAGGGPPPGARLNEISDILAMVRISNPRRAVLNGRPSLAYDFTGDPKAHSHGMEQGAAKKVSGTIWFDEADHQVARMQARFDDNFHIGGGVFASVQKGTTMEVVQSPVGDGLWMQTSSAEHLDARVVVKKFRQDIYIKDFEFKRFNTGVIQQPGPPSK